MSSSNPSTRGRKERGLAPSRLSNRIAGKIAEPLSLPSVRKNATSLKKNLGATPRKLQGVQRQSDHFGSGDEGALSEPGLCNSQDLSKEVGETLNTSANQRMEPICHQTGYASDQGGRSFYHSIKSASNNRGPSSSSFNILSTSLLRPSETSSAKKNEQKGVQELNLLRNVQDGTSVPISLAVPRPTEKGSIQEKQTEPESIIDPDNFVTKEFFCTTLNNLFHSLENVIDKNTVTTEQKISEQVKYFKNLSINQTSALDMIGEITDEIQNYFSTEVEPLNNYFKDLSENLKEELKTLSFKGKEIKTLEQKFNDVIINLNTIKMEQQILSDKLDNILLSNKFQPEPSVPTELPSVKTDQAIIPQPIKSNESVISGNTSLEIEKEVRQQMLASIPKTSEWPTFTGEGEYDHTEFIEWIDTLKSDIDLHDRIIVSRLNLLLKNSANEWYKGLKKEFGLQNWDWWKNQINVKFGNATWRRRIQKSFYTSRFDANSTPVAAWGN